MTEEREEFGVWVEEDDDRVDDMYAGSLDEYMAEVLPTLLGGRLVDYAYKGATADGPWRAIPEAARRNVRVLHPVDIAEAMRSGVEAPEMLVEDWLVKDELHWVSAQKETAKTWLALTLCVAVME